MLALLFVVCYPTLTGYQNNLRVVRVGATVMLIMWGALWFELIQCCAL